MLAAVSAAGYTGWLVYASIVHRRLRASHHDPVTGLPARATWTREARKILRRGHHLVVLIDLDRFKDVNDTYGHAAGDHLLTVTAARLRAWADRTGGGACGRLGGDEFVIVTRDPVDGSGLATLTGMLTFPVTLPTGETVPAGASAGASDCTGAADLSAALGAADKAMYEAKRAGGGWRLTAHPPRPAASGPGRRGNRSPVSQER
jgi:diguanylate cyclase (GGDEF)-like protein